MASMTAKMRSPFLICTVGVVVTLALTTVLLRDTGTNLGLVLPWVVLGTGCLISALSACLALFYARAHENQKCLTLSHLALNKATLHRDEVQTSKQTLDAALHHGQKLQAMGTLAGGIAHDFNNLLYAIHGYTELCQQEADKNSLLYTNLGKIQEASKRGQSLVARILEFSRHQHHQMSPLFLKDTIENALALLRPTIPSSVSIELHCPPSITVLGNQTQLHQVLVNLITNAVDAMEGEGRISITVEKSAGSTDLPPGPYCKIEVTDTGHGMEPGVMNRIFEPFYTTKEVGKGTGLGLSIVHNIINEHHGRIDVSSTLGQGTTFTLLIPEYTLQEGETVTHG